MKIFYLFSFKKKSKENEQMRKVEGPYEITRKFEDFIKKTAHIFE